MNMKTNNNCFFNKIAYGIAGLVMVFLIVLLLRLSTHAWISQLLWH